jgi:hypothetical protein
MRAQRRIQRDPRCRALVLLLLCALGLGLATGAHSAPAHKHVTHAAAVLAVVTSDTAHGTLRTEQPGAVALPAVAAVALAGRVGTSDSSTRTSSRTAHAPQVRGPPGEALA